MFTSFKILLISLIYIINIKFSLCDPIDKCEGKYSTFTMNCKSSILTPNLACTSPKVIREDGLNCWRTKNDGEAERNFFGGYFSQPQQIKGEYQNIIKTPTIFEDNIKSKDDCKNERLILCQQLINNCILNLWEDQNNEYCGLIRKVGLGEHLEFQESDKTTEVSNTYTLDSDNTGDNRRLNFWVAKFGINGTFINFVRLENDFLQCNSSEQGKTSYKYYGNNYISECNIYIDKYKNDESNFLYEIFLQNNHESTEEENIQLIKIPVRITNINNYETYRMFLHYYDTTQQGGDTIFYARKVKLYVKTLNSDNEYKIQLPYFEVTYERKSVVEKIDYTFEAEYKSDISGFMKTMKVFFWILTVIAILMVLLSILVDSKMIFCNVIVQNKAKQVINITEIIIFQNVIFI